MDQIICCLLGICCAPGSPEHRAAYEAQIALHFGGDTEKAKKVCDATYTEFVKMTKKIAAAVKKAEPAA